MFCYLFYIPAFSVSLDIDEDSLNNTSYQINTRSLPDWCSLTCGPEKYQNIVCQMGGHCKAMLPCKFDAIDRQKIVDEHNKLRNKFAAGDDARTSNLQAANLAALDWDDDLAFTASCNLARCGPVDQDLCHITPTFNKSSGQNLWSQMLTKDSLRDCVRESITAVQKWYDEINSVTEDQLSEIIDSYKYDRKLGHFTQIIWAETTHVGCALVTSEVGGQKTCVLACNYGPGGNIEGAQMFEEGRPCSQCSNGLKCGEFYDALCGDGRLRGRANIHVQMLMLLLSSCYL